MREKESPPGERGQVRSRVSGESGRAATAVGPFPSAFSLRFQSRTRSMTEIRPARNASCGIRVWNAKVGNRVVGTEMRSPLYPQSGVTLVGLRVRRFVGVGREKRVEERKLRAGQVN